MVVSLFSASLINSLVKSQAKLDGNLIIREQAMQEKYVGKME